MTAREFKQTVELAMSYGLAPKVVSRHGGRTSIGKAVNLLSRSFSLAWTAAPLHPDVAVSHNSYTHTIAGRLIGARVVTMVVTIMDYEGQPANHIAFRLAHRVVVPEEFAAGDLVRFVADSRKVHRYEGLKEQVYLSDFLPDPSFFDGFRKACGLGKYCHLDDTVLVTVRTPATMAAYHQFENDLFEKLLSRLQATPRLTVVLLPRNHDQRAYYRERYPRIHMPRQPLPGSDLVFYSDLVVSAGGTMNREAAVLGTPVSTIFAGELPAVDKAFIAMGRLTSLKSESDVNMLPLVKKERLEPLTNPKLCADIVRCIVEW